MLRGRPLWPAWAVAALSKVKSILARRCRYLGVGFDSALILSED
jgi:hypothetical protein